MTEFHVDAFRLDAVHAIVDHSARHFLEELAETVYRQAEFLGRRCYLMTETDVNDPRFIRPRIMGGYGLDAQWNDDFHHALLAFLTGERSGYFGDYGTVHHLARAITDGFVYSGQYSPYRRRRHGASSRDLPASKFIVFAQNHDQVGNPTFGQRISKLTGFEQLKLTAAMVLLAPAIPLIFMGEEYGEDNPFFYFIDHSDAALVDAVRRGRREEFAKFAWRGELPEPQDENTFYRSRLDHTKKGRGQYAVLQSLYRELLLIRRTSAPLTVLDRDALEVSVDEARRLLAIQRWYEEQSCLALFCFSTTPVEIPHALFPWVPPNPVRATHVRGASCSIRRLSPGENPVIGCLLGSTMGVKSAS